MRKVFDTNFFGAIDVMKAVLPEMRKQKSGLIINVTADSVIRLLPSFIMTDDEADQVVAILAPLIKDFTQD